MAEKKKFRLDEWIAAVLLAVMAVITFVNVFNRFVLKKSLAFSEEVTVNLFVWITILGIAIAYRRGSHLQMTNLYDSFPPALKRLSIALSGILSTALFIFLIFNSCKEIYKNMTFYHTTSDALNIPTWIYSLGTPVFSLFVLKEIIASTLNGIKKNKKKADTTEGGK